MRGLLINQYYSVSKSIFLYTIVGIIISSFLLFLSIPYTRMIGTLIVMLFLVTPALEFLKREAVSGWDEYVTTLPLKRKAIVKSHYQFYLILLGLATLISSVIVISSRLMLSNESMDVSTLAMIINCISIVIGLGVFVFPATYLWDSSRADAIILVASLISVMIYQGVALLYAGILQNTSERILPWANQDMVFSLFYFILSVLMFLISYLVSIKIYNTKVI